MSKKHKRNKKEGVDSILNSLVTRDGNKFSKESEDDLFQSDDIDWDDYDIDYESMFDDSEGDLEIDADIDYFDDSEDDFEIDDVDYFDEDDDLDINVPYDEDDFEDIDDDDLAVNPLYEEDVFEGIDALGSKHGDSNVDLFGEFEGKLDDCYLEDLIFGDPGIDLYQALNLDEYGKSLTKKIKKSIKKRDKYLREHNVMFLDVPDKSIKVDKLIKCLKDLIDLREVIMRVSSVSKTRDIDSIFTDADNSSRYARVNRYINNLSEKDLKDCGFNFDYIIARTDMLRTSRLFTSDDLQFILRDTNRVFSLSDISAETTYGTPKMNSKAYILIRTEDGIKEIYVSQLLDLIGELSVLAKSDSFDSFCRKLGVSHESEVYTSLMYRSSDIFNLVYMLSEVYGSSYDNKISYVMDRLEEMDLITLCYMLLVLSRGYAKEICLLPFIRLRRYMVGFSRT